MPASVMLADACELITKGTTPSTLGFKVRDHGIPFIRAQNLVDGTVSIAVDPLFIDRPTHDALQRSKVRPRDLLLSIAGTIGRAAVVPDDAEEMNCNQAVAIIRPYSHIDRRYLLRWFESREAQSQITRGKVTATIANLSLGQIGKLRIKLPPLDEQRRIAAILDEADTVRRKRERTLELLSALGQSIFLQMFGDPKHRSDRWPSLRFADACQDNTSLSEKIQRTAYRETGRYPVVDQGKRFIAGWTNDEEKVTIVRNPVVVFGDHTRSVKYIDFDFVVGADGAKVLLPSQSFNARFFAALLNLMPIPDLGYSRHMRALKELRFPCPPLERQVRFTKIVKQIEKQRDSLQSQVRVLESLFVSLQDRAFSGQL